MRERLRNLAPKVAGFRRVHVVGAGTMGGDIAAWCSLRGLAVTLQDRGGREQRVTLRTGLPGRPPLVAVADNPDLARALSDAKGELIRQLEHQKSAREPMNNRRLRSATIRHPNTSAPPEITELAV